MPFTTPSWFVSIDRRILHLLALAAILAAAAGCTSAGAKDWAEVRDRTPDFLAEKEARDPAVAADSEGRVALTFVTKDSSGTDLWLTTSRDGGATFAEPARVNARAGAVSSFYEGRPVAAFGNGGRLIVAWTQRRASGPGADLITRTSADGGATLADPVVVNDDTSGRPVHHGFPAIVFSGENAVTAAWLDERDSPPSEGEPPYSAVYTATSRDGGRTWSGNRKVADLVCGCCRPAMLADSAGGMVASYRSARDNLRDPMLAASAGGEGFEAFTISADRWHMEGCPVVGPVLAGDTRGGWCAWYTGAEPAGIYLVPWRSDRGATGERRRIDEGIAEATQPRMAPGGDATWFAVLGRSSSDSARTVLAVRRIGRDGGLSSWVELGTATDAGWITASGERTLLACWAQGKGAHSRVRVAELQRRR